MLMPIIPLFLRKQSMKKLMLASVLVMSVTSQIQAAGRDVINIVGSSTVYPFATVVAERFGKSSSFKTPKIESTGSGGGMKLFCAGNGINTPDIANASRRIKKSEFEKCQANDVKNITEVLIGYDGIVLANSTRTKPLKLSRKDIFLALAKEIPAEEGSKKLILNPNKTWKDVNSDLPEDKIEVLGPPPTSGTRDAFVELALEGGCSSFNWIAKINDESKVAKAAGNEGKAKELKAQFKFICHTVREDGAYIEAGENDNLIVRKLQKNPKALGIFGFSFLDQNSDVVQGSFIDDADPSFENIASGTYPISRPLYFYVKGSHVGVVPGVKEYIEEFTSEDAMGEDGYLVDKGLIPLPKKELKQVRDDTDSLKNLEL
jgi:phosphate transport system substrate-binding protein